MNDVTKMGSFIDYQGKRVVPSIGPKATIPTERPGMRFMPMPEGTPPDRLRGPAPIKDRPVVTRPTMPERPSFLPIGDRPKTPIARPAVPKPGATIPLRPSMPGIKKPPVRKPTFLRAKAVRTGY